MKTASKSAWMLALGLVLAATVARAAAVKPGDEAPKWSNLKGVDDSSRGLADFKDAKLIVVVFTANVCPVAKAYEDRLIALQRDYKSKGVQLVAINPNDSQRSPGDSIEKMKERAKSKEFNFPYLLDESQDTAHAYGAATTPHVFVLDGQRKIAYVGAIDDNMKADKVTTKYLRDALDALLDGKSPPKAETKPFGCGVKYR